MYLPMDLVFTLYTSSLQKARKTLMDPVIGNGKGFEHRVYSKEVPENTFQKFRKALELFDFVVIWSEKFILYYNKIVSVCRIRGDFSSISEQTSYYCEQFANFCTNILTIESIIAILKSSKYRNVEPGYRMLIWYTRDVTELDHSFWSREIQLEMMGWLMRLTGISLFRAAAFFVT